MVKFSDLTMKTPTLVTYLLILPLLPFCEKAVSNFVNLFYSPLNRLNLQNCYGKVLGPFFSLSTFTLFAQIQNEGHAWNGVDEVSFIFLSEILMNGPLLQMKKTKPKEAFPALKSETLNFICLAMSAVWNVWFDWDMQVQCNVDYIFTFLCFC